VQKRDARLAAGAEIAAEAELHAGKEAVPDVAAQILPARGGDGGIRREEAVCLLQYHVMAVMLSE